MVALNFKIAHGEASGKPLGFEIKEADRVTSRGNYALARTSWTLASAVQSL